MWLLVDALPQLNADGSIRQVICTFIDINKRKEAEEALRKSEDLFNKAFHGSPSPMTIASQKDGRYIAVNDSFLRLVGLTREQVVGKTGNELDLIDEHSRSRIRSVLNQKGTLHNIEIQARSSTGRQLNLLTSIENTNLAGEPCTIVTMLDITERKLAEEALSQSESKFRKIYEEGPFGMALINSEFRIINANSTFCQLMGYSENELQNLTFRDITYKTIENEEQFITNLIKGEIPVFKTEKQYKRKDSKVIWGALTVTANFSHDGKFLYNLAIVEDISARKHAEEELLENKAYLDAALASMADAVFISDKTGKFILFNEAFATFHRFPDKESCSKQFSDYPDILNVFLPNGEEAPVDRWAVSRALSGEVAVNEEYIVQRKDTGEKWIGSYNFGPIRDSNGEIMGSVVVGRDITHLKDNENKIRSLNETLEQRVEERTAQLKAVNKELEAFSYSVSHDLRAPLRSINGFTQILMEEYAPKIDSEGSRICDIIMQSSKKMGVLIDDLLAFSRLSRSEMTTSEINMRDLITLSYNDLIVHGFNKKIELNIGDICDSEGDPNMIKQVWTNLLSNAIKYSSKNDLIKIDINCHKADGINTYSIKDNGVGFDMEFKEKLFGVFQRLHSVADFEGTGVGLAIVQRIVIRHGGSVWAKGEVGTGAEFYFSLPRKQNISLKKE
jgi:PAS domain S-box-containing protein